jgi:hypothetical protein
LHRLSVSSLVQLVDEVPRVKSIRDVTIPGGKPNKWDCADASPAEVAALISGAGEAAETEAAAEVTCMPLDLPDLSTIERRRFIYGTIYQRGVLSLTGGLGGGGKSVLHIVEAICIATGRDLHETGRKIERCNVWLLSLEDDRNEMYRRIGAALMHFNIDKSEIGDRIFMTTRQDAPDFLIARSDRDGFHVSHKTVARFASEIVKRDIGVTIIDPYVYAHEINENDNMGQAAVMKALAAVAVATKSSIELVHHSKKPPANDRGEPSSSDMRGASSITNSSRHGRLVLTMSAADANKMGVEKDKRSRYFSTANVKTSYSPPGHNSKWFKLLSVTLPNGDADEEGDGVGVVTRWRPPDPFEVMGVTVDTLRAVQAEVARTCRADTPYRLSDKTKSGPWIGELIADKTGLDPSIKEERAKIALILRAWLNTGALIVDREWSDGHQKRPIIRSGPAA